MATVGSNFTNVGNIEKLIRLFLFGEQQGLARDKNRRMANSQRLERLQSVEEVGDGHCSCIVALCHHIVYIGSVCACMCVCAHMHVYGLGRGGAET